MVKTDKPFLVLYAYVIKSLGYDDHYKGHCEDLEKRLAQHNAGETQSNKKYPPCVIVYFEKFDTREEAVNNEKYFKSAAGRRYLKTKMVP